MLKLLIPVSWWDTAMGGLRIAVHQFLIHQYTRFCYHHAVLQSVERFKGKKFKE